MTLAALLIIVLGLTCGTAQGQVKPAALAPSPTPAPQILNAISSFSPGMTHARLSPDGKFVATIDYAFGMHSINLAEVKDMEFRQIGQNKPGRAGFYTFSKIPQSLTWLSNDLIAINYNLGATAVNLEGKFVADLGERLIGRIKGGDPARPTVIVYSDLEDMEIARVELGTRKKTRYSFPMSGKPINFVLDDTGEPRAVTMIDSSFWKDATTITNWYKPSAKEDWIKLAVFKVTDDYWVPIYVPKEENTLVISSRVGRDTYAIFSYDTKTFTIGEMMAGHPSVDIVDADGFSEDAFQRVWTSGMQPQQIWFDPVWGALQNSVDKALPNRINTMSGDPKNKVLVFSRGDVDPGTWYILDTAKMELRHLGKYHAFINPADMRPMKSVSYPARDGLAIPAFLTLPAGASRALPTVVMIHGGPTMRDAWAFDSDVQVLASQGYAVLQPQFRGSSGFGRKFEQAGYGQWGLAMQDDVSAGVDFLVKQGIADPKRICIYGASYGGYAALWGLVKTPELYRCGISFAGVVDLDLMFSDSSDRTKDNAALELMRSRIGDAKLNKQQFDLVSPLKHAARIQAPVLLMHGEEDQRVPLVHGKKMHRALVENNKAVEWISFEGEGHGLSGQKSQRDYFTALLAFLDRHIGQGLPPTHPTKKD